MIYCTQEASFRDLVHSSQVYALTKRDVHSLTVQDGFRQPFLH